MTLCSLSLYIGLANSPTVNFNNKTGQVVFISEYNNGILVDYYQVIVRDASGQDVFNKRYSNTSNSVNIAERIQQSVCSPYTLIVQAHSFFGISTTDIIIESHNNSKGTNSYKINNDNYYHNLTNSTLLDPCTCIRKNGKVIIIIIILIYNYFSYSDC